MMSTTQIVKENQEAMERAAKRAMRSKLHCTAPTIHAEWAGQVTLEIANVGPFDIVLQEDDIIAQITVATISSIPKVSMEKFGSTTIGQKHVGGSQPDVNP